MAKNQKIEWKNTEVRLGDLLPWERNPRKIDRKNAELLEESWVEFGQVEMIAIGPGDQIYNGHQRLKVLLDRFGPDYRVEARRSSRELSEKEREKLTALLHKGAAGDWDFEKLRDWNPDDLLLWGFDACELVWIDRESKKEDPALDGILDRHAELRQSYGVELGQIWQLGDHRLACGDCRDPFVWSVLMGDELAHCAWSDPPYGVNYVGKTPDALTIENDSAEDIPALLAASFELCDEFLVEGGPIYIASPSGMQLLDFMLAFKGAGWHLHEGLAWVKNTMVLGHQDYHYQHETILYGWKGSGHPWYGGRDQKSVFNLPKPSRSAEHPTIKPTRLIELQLCNSTQPGEIVVDFFVGSGSTLLACDNLFRRCRAIERDPDYVAVTLERWVQQTGKSPKVSEYARAVA